MAVGRAFRRLDGRLGGGVSRPSCRMSSHPATCCRTGGGEHAAHQVDSRRRRGQRRAGRCAGRRGTCSDEMKTVPEVPSEMIAPACADRAGADGRGGVVARAGARPRPSVRQAQRRAPRPAVSRAHRPPSCQTAWASGRSVTPQRSSISCELQRLCCHVEQQGAGSVGIVGGVHAGEPVRPGSPSGSRILAMRAKLVRLVLAHPEELGRGKAGKSDVCRSSAVSLSLPTVSLR